MNSAISSNRLGAFCVTDIGIAFATPVRKPLQAFKPVLGRAPLAQLGPERRAPNQPSGYSLLPCYPVARRLAAAILLPTPAPPPPCCGPPIGHCTPGPASAPAARPARQGGRRTRRRPPPRRTAAAPQCRSRAASADPTAPGSCRCSGGSA